MEYFDEVLDRRTGELVAIATGSWITITELGDLHQVGRREMCNDNFGVRLTTTEMAGFQVWFRNR